MMTAQLSADDLAYINQHLTHRKLVDLDDVVNYHDESGRTLFHKIVVRSLNSVVSIIQG